jgi:hypothetical protein
MISYLLINILQCLKITEFYHLKRIQIKRDRLRNNQKLKIDRKKPSAVKAIKCDIENVCMHACMPTTIRFRFLQVQQTSFHRNQFDKESSKQPAKSVRKNKIYFYDGINLQLNILCFSFLGPCCCCLLLAMMIVIAIFKKSFCFYGFVDFFSSTACFSLSLSVDSHLCH